MGGKERGGEGKRRGQEGREGKERKEGRGRNGMGWEGRGAPPLLILQFNHGLKGVISNDFE